MLNNRQGNNNRRRGRNNNNQRPQGNGQGRNGETGNRIDNRARGNAPQLLEKYKTLARDAQMQGDRVLTEYYHQFADHYFRVVAETRTRFEENQPRRSRDDWDESDGNEPQGESRASYDDGGDEEENGERGYEANRRPQRYAPQANTEGNAGERDDDRSEPAPQRERVPFEARQNGNRERSERAPREDRAQNENRPQREDRAPREDRLARRPRFERPVADTAAVDAAPRADEQPMMLDLNVLPPSIAAVSVAEAEAAPKKRGRPRKVVTESEIA